MFQKYGSAGGRLSLSIGALCGVLGRREGGTWLATDVSVDNAPRSSSEYDCSHFGECYAYHRKQTF